MQVARRRRGCSGVTGLELESEVGESDTRRKLMDTVWRGGVGWLVRVGDDGGGGCEGEQRRLRSLAHVHD